MHRHLYRPAIVILSLSLPVLAWAQQSVGERGPRAGERMAEQQARSVDSARSAQEQRPARATEAQADPRRSLSEAVRRVQRRTGGQILGAELVPFEGRNISRIKYMDDRGRVRYMDDPGPGERMRQVPPRRDNNGQP